MLEFDFIRENWTFIAGGIGATLGVSVVALLLAIPLALIVGLGRRSAVPPIRYDIHVGLKNLWLDLLPYKYPNFTAKPAENAKKTFKTWRSSRSLR